MSGRTGGRDRSTPPAAGEPQDLSYLIPDSRVAGSGQETYRPLPGEGPAENGSGSDGYPPLADAAPPENASAASGSETSSPAEVPVESSEEVHGDARIVLTEIDQLSVALRRRGTSGGSAEPPASSVSPRSPPTEAWDEGHPSAAGVSPYLEERLAIASASVAGLSQELRDLGERWQRLESAAELLEQELSNASREIGFLRVPGGVAGGAPAPMAVPRGAVRSNADLSAPPFSATTLSHPYSGFTIARYNSTIGGLKARRRRLAWWTFAVAVGISAVLVSLSLFAREPVPALWLAFLPGVWMIPVPFFLLSFFGTQRVLRRNHLDLVGDP